MTSRRTIIGLTGFLMASFLAVAPLPSEAGDCCLEPDNGFGTATLPAFNGTCIYYGSTEIVDGLGGPTIQINGFIGLFSGVTESPGGTLSGTTSNGFSGIFYMSMTGTGALTGFNRIIQIPLVSERIDWGPRVPFAPFQSAPAEYMFLQGQIPPGDPDFDFLRVTGGDLFGYPTPGAIQLVSSGGGWLVSGYFDLYHRIDFIGAPASVLAGRSGSTVRQRRFTLCNFEPVPTLPTTWSRIKALMED